MTAKPTHLPANTPLARIAAVYKRGMMAVGCTMLGIIVVVMGVQVFFRYVLNDSLIWAEELCRYLLVWISFLFLGLAFQRGEMVALNFVLMRLRRPMQIVLTSFAYGVSIALMVALVWYGFAFAEVNAIQTLPAFDFIWSSVSGTDETLDISAFWLYAAVPVGAAFLGIHMAVALVVRVRRIARGIDVFAEVGEIEIAEGTR